MVFIRLLGAIGCFMLAGFVGSKGFYLPNSAAADICFGTAATLGLLGFICLIIG